MPATAGNVNPLFISKPRLEPVQILPADTTVAKALFTPGTTEGAIVTAIKVTSTDTVAQILQFSIFDGALDHILGEVSIPAGSGTDGQSATVDVLDATKIKWCEADGTLHFPTNATSRVLRVRSKVAVTAGKIIDLLVSGGDY